MQTLAEFQEVYRLPLPELIFRAASVHRQHHDAGDIQRCALLSIKTGGCAEDCGYCAQSAHFKTGVAATPLMSLDDVRDNAIKAKAMGAMAMFGSSLALARAGAIGRFSGARYTKLATPRWSIPNSPRADT